MKKAKTATPKDHPPSRNFCVVICQGASSTEGYSGSVVDTSSEARAEVAHHHNASYNAAWTSVELPAKVSESVKLAIATAMAEAVGDWA
jgi:hypothetical protein